MTTKKKLNGRIDTIWRLAAQRFGALEEEIDGLETRISDLEATMRLQVRLEALGGAGPVAGKTITTSLAGSMWPAPEHKRPEITPPAPEISDFEQALVYLGVGVVGIVSLTGLAYVASFLVSLCG